MINKKIYEDKAKQMTEEYLKDNPDLEFIVVYDEDEEGKSFVSFKIVKKEKENQCVI